jgi:hypothetical protein
VESALIPPVIALPMRRAARLFAPVTAEQLSGLRAYEVVLRMPGRDGRPSVAGGMIDPPDPPDPATAAEIVAASDRRDTRPLAEVRAEVGELADGDEQPPPPAGDVDGMDEK